MSEGNSPWLLKLYIFLDLQYSLTSEILQQQSQRYEKKQKFVSDVIDQAAGLKVRRKKSHLLVRKLNLNKFLSSPEQEIRRTPESGDSKSQSQFLQGSPVHSHILSRPATKKLKDNILENKQTKVEGPEKLLKTLELPSLTVTSFPKIFQKGEPFLKTNISDSMVFNYLCIWMPSF